MARVEIRNILERANLLAAEINNFVPNNPKSIEFRADLAGLLVVAIVASYESCVKETLINFASRHHNQFGIFAQNHFSYINRRINLSDLYRYANTFDRSIDEKFKKLIKLRRNNIMQRIGSDFTTAYKQILSWRDDFAHAGFKNTTVEEAIKNHRLAKRVLYSFDDAFN